jgi:hypothetical protein
MAGPIVPFAKPLLICETHVARNRGKIDFLGAFQSISPTTYPYTLDFMSVVAHLSGGLGLINTYMDIRQADTMTLVATTIPREINFSDREKVVCLVQSFDRTVFPVPGMYLIELHCEHACIADTRLLLRTLPPV